MGKEKMLIVDDSRLSRMMIKGFANSSNPNWEILEAENGDDALAKVAGQDIQWFTVDYNMPGMDGLTLCLKLKKQFPKARIGLLTASIQDNVKEQTENMGVDFIQKPITEVNVMAFLKS